MLKIILLANLFLLAACTTLNNTATFLPKGASDNRVIVYIYRPLNTANAMYSPELFIDKEYKLSIKNGQYLPVTLNARETIFEVAPDKKYSGQTRLPLTLIAGQSYFIRVDSSLKIKNTVAYEPYQRTFNLTNIDEQSAITEIEKCCLAKETIINDDGPLLDKAEQTEPGFSVDKTQNPFSR